MYVSIQIVTDSSCDLPSELVNANLVEVVPLTVRINNKEYLEGVTISAADFATEMARSETLPKTSQPSPQAFLDVFNKITRTAGEAAEILCITLSSKLSGTFQSAQVAQKLHQGKVAVIDSLSGSLGLGLMVLEARRLAQEGLSLSDITAHLQALRTRTEVLVSLDTLENAVKGGRVNWVQSAVAQILRFKIFVHTVEGRVEVCDRVRGKVAVINRFLEGMAERGEDFRNRVIGIAHVDNLKEAEALAQAIIERFSPLQVIVAPMGSTIATYAGKGAVALAF